MDEPKFEPHVWDEMPSSSHGMERLPISPYTGEPYDPSWATPLHGGIRIRKGRFAKDIHRQRRTRKKQGEQLLKWLGMALIVCGTALTLAGITGSLFTLFDRSSGGR